MLFSGFRMTTARPWWDLCVWQPKITSQGQVKTPKTQKRKEGNRLSTADNLARSWVTFQLQCVANEREQGPLLCTRKT